MAYYNRKHIRLKNYDYSQYGYYYVTIHTAGDEHILSNVGRGLAPACYEIKLTEIGKIAEQQLFALEERFKGVKIDKYVIMPNHIHAVIIIGDNAENMGKAGASPRPTLPDIICAYKSITTRICNKNDNIQGRKIFQTSFYESIIRNEKAYCSVWEYIENNPLKWIIDKMQGGDY
ncbi:MAG: transposase [Ruminococcus sp.]|nr:transposase [Ruminococcus sp.]MCM1382450.1 transposase [Muribaculaceae bacterium]MCM1479403.1 transposase [Muribaculaceae bacterium]